MKISENKYVTLSYDLNVGEGEERELMEQATAESRWSSYLVPTQCSKRLKNRSRAWGREIPFHFNSHPRRLMVIMTNPK